jgi:hypothetical protein
MQPSWSQDGQRSRRPSRPRAIQSEIDDRDTLTAWLQVRRVGAERAFLSDWQLGPRDLQENGTVEIHRRDTMEKETVSHGRLSMSRIDGLAGRHTERTCMQKASEIQGFTYHQGGYLGGVQGEDRAGRFPALPLGRYRRRPKPRYRKRPRQQSAASLSTVQCVLRRASASIQASRLTRESFSPEHH